MSTCLEFDLLQELSLGQVSAEELQRVESHVDTCNRCRDLVAHLAQLGPPPPGSLLSSLGEALPQGERLARGALVGRYVVLGTLGRGGMGSVYLAYDPELDRKVALKLVPLRGSSDATDGPGRSRVLREAQAVARLSHPNVVTVFDAGTSGTSVFLAMELFDGGTFAEWLHAAPRPWRQVVATLSRAGRGLAAAHEAGLTHGDFKPDNILLGRDGRVCVGDFGLAGPSPMPSAAPSEMARIAGTPAYMAPEALSGQETSPRSDQFSFCVTLFEALAGARPFPGSTFAQRREGLGQPPSAASVGQIPAAIRRVLLQGLSPDPAQRHPTLNALLEQLDQVATRRKRLTLTAVRFAGVAALSLGVAVALSASPARLLLPWAVDRAVCRDLGAPIAEVWNAPRREQIRQALRATRLGFFAETSRSVETLVDRFGEDWTAARTEACEATRVRGVQSDEALGLRTECLDRRLQELKNLLDLFERPTASTVEFAVQAASGLEVRSCSDLAALRQPVRPPTSEAARSELAHLRQRTGAVKALVETGQHREALEASERLLPAVEALGFPPLLGELLMYSGKARRLAGDYGGALAALRRAAYSAGIGRDDTLAAEIQYELVQTTCPLGFKPELAPLFAEGLAMLVERNGAGDRVRSRLEATRAQLAFYASRDLEAAREHTTRALELAVRAWGPEHFEVATLRSFRGSILADMGRAREGVAEQLAALELRKHVFGAEHPSVASSLNNLANGYRLMGDLERSLETNQACHALRIKALGPSHPLTLSSESNIARVLLLQGHPRAALDRYEALLPRLVEARGATNSRVFDARFGQGLALRRLGRVGQARTVHQAALELAEKSSGANHPLTGEALVLLAEDELAQGEGHSARRLLERALTMLESTSHRDLLALAQWRLSQALRAVNGDATLARDLEAKARAVFADAPGLHALELSENLRAPAEAGAR
jgi:eukaryotic-like serine/threonine-protein kinase